MMENKKLIYGILVVCILAAIGVGWFVYLNKSIITEEIKSFEECEKAGYPVLQSYPRQCKTPDGKIFVERISCQDSLNCPRQMKCENSVCVDVGCIKEGETGPSAGINPEWLDHLPTECCLGLKSITYSGYYDEDCNWRPLFGAPSIVCTKCGNGQCEKGETKCNCPEDCK